MIRDGPFTTVHAALSLCAVLLMTSGALASTWTVYEPLHIPQASPPYSEVIPGEDLDPAHPYGTNINWSGGLTSPDVRFFPSWSWGTPVAGDWLCWLYDTNYVVWWEGVFNEPSDSLTVQLASCNSNDGWADIYVDGAYEFSYNSYHASSTNVVITGEGLNYGVHTVKIQTRAYGGDVSLDYVAAPAIPEPSTLPLLVLGAVLLTRRR